MLKFTQMFCLGFAVIFFFFWLLTGCASVHQGNFAEPVEESQPKVSDSTKSQHGLVISGEENERLASQYFGQIDLTFENTTPGWLHVKEVSVDFGDPQIDRQVQIPLGQELVAWAKASSERKEVQDYNTGLVLSSVMALGGALALGAGSHDARALGAVVMLGGASALTAQQIENSRLNLQFSESFAKLVPESHLLSGEFVIPPGLHSKKWITFFTPAPGEIPKLTTLHLSYTLADGQREHAVLKFRSKQTMSEWQYHQFEGAKHMRQPAGSEKLVQNVSG